MNRASARYALAASAMLLAMAVLMVAWEAWIAPIRPGGSWLLLKALPPLFLLPRIWRGNVYTFKWAPLVMMLYFTEGVVRAWSEAGASRLMASLEIVLAVAFIACCWKFIKATGHPSR
jgi:uncharacterized membrane protein